MTISSNSLTLAQYAQLSNDPVIRAATIVLIDNESIMARDLPMEVANTFKVSGTRWSGEGIQTPTWTTLNSAPTVPAGVSPTPFEERAFLIRHMITTDRKFLRDRNSIGNPHAFQVAAFLEGMAYDFNYRFFNNRWTGTNAEPNCFVGLRERLDDNATWGTKSENKINGNGVDLTLNGSSAVSFGNFCELLDQLLWSVGSPVGAGVVLYMNAGLQRRISNLARRYSGQGGLSVATDQLGREVLAYKAAQVRIVGRKSDQTTEIITSTETSSGADGSSSYTSVYAVRYGGDDGLRGWLFDPFTVVDDCDHPDRQTHYGTFIEWHGGIYYQNPRCLGRIYGIKVS